MRSAIDKSSWAAQLTAPGRGAVAVIAMLGRDLESLVAPMFRAASGRPLDQLDQPIVYGRWKSSGEDLVLVRRPASETQDEQLEIQCHGGQVAVQAILKKLEETGFDLVSARQWIGRRDGFWEAEAQAAVSGAQTQRVADLILDRWQCQQSALNQLRQQIDVADNSLVAVEEVDRLLGWRSLTNRLSGHQSIVICGQPNVGKSSLINAMVGFTRSIVNQQAGTTRDVVTQRTAIAGWPVELTDTAGLRDSLDPIENLGVGRARRAIERAAMCLAVFEAHRPWTDENQRLLDELPKAIVVFNKADLVPASNDLSSDGRPPGIYVSAINGQHVETLLDRIEHALEPELPPTDQWIPLTAAQLDRLEKTRNAIVAGRLELAKQLLADGEWKSAP